jgi:diketogulonate reductase-like aldo/keto reductase
MEIRLSRRGFLGLAGGLAMQALAGRAGAAPSACTPLRRAIPKGGETLPVVGLGTWQGLDRAHLDNSTAVVARFLELGGELIDTAPMYGDAESAIGEVVRALDARERLFIATKVLSTGRDAGRAQMRRSFEALGVARLDLMQVHNLVDWRTQLATRTELRDSGKLRYVGVTHYTVGAHAELEAIVRREPIDFVQVNYNLAVRDAERSLLPAAKERGVAVIVNRPFEEGALFGRVRGRPLPEWAGEIGCASFAQLFLKFILANEAVTCVIPGSDKPEYMVDNLNASRGRLPDVAMRRRMVEFITSLS